MPARLLRRLPHGGRESPIRSLLLACAVALSATGCASHAESAPGADAMRAHHTAEGFRNTTVGTVNKPLSDLLRWRWRAWRDDLPPPAQAPTPVMLPDLARLKAYGSAMRRVGTGGTPVQHWSARGLNDRNRTLWGGWVVHANDLHWYFSGDTGYSRDFADTREHLQRRRPGERLDLALLAIGAYEPRWFMAPQHMNPAEAVQAHRDLGARRSLGVHWGTFALTDEALDQPPRDLAAARQAAGIDGDEFFLLAIGQTRWLPARPARQSAP